MVKGVGAKTYSPQNAYNAGALQDHVNFLIDGPVYGRSGDLVWVQKGKDYLLSAGFLWRLFMEVIEDILRN